ncbi:transglycosylase domain-containing protein [Amycolatopsis sulphurea]|uniref:transglycosylase domain-containing protein n=1 Tax=Amycolatopsis sulphurea TaxID=76022 RepID=UPI000BF62370|nr:transglycosylase domain-containing protein [Amycolatopsis sulphurea]
MGPGAAPVPNPGAGLGGPSVNDDRHRPWPGQEPDAPRRAHWPEQDPGPGWPAGEAPRRPAPPRRPPAGGPRPPRAPQAGGPAWPGGDDPGPQWPSGDEPPRRPQRPRQNQPSRILDGPPPRRQPPPPGAGRPGPNGGPPQGFRQPPPPGSRSGPVRRPPHGRPVPVPIPPPEYPDREPDLITHAEHNGTTFGYDPYDDRYDDHDDETQYAQFAAEAEPEPEDGEEDGQGKKKKSKADLTPKQRKKRRWKIIRRVLYACVGLFVVVPAIAFVITYFTVSVPTPQDIRATQSQPITFYFGNNQQMGRSVPADGDRELLQPNQVPDVIKHAIYAAEDATFETNSGFDVMAIARSVFNQVTGGTGGGSTISQQYIKQATKNDAPTLTRKWTELVKSFKLNNETPKADIFTSYVNIVYFGRGANGVAAAAKAYYGKDISQVTPSEAALLAGLIQGPSRSEDQTYTMKRWTYVMDQMVANHWLSAADRKAAVFPTLIPKGSQKKDNGNVDYFIQQRIIDELEAKGYDQDKLYNIGAKIHTTIDPKAQQEAARAVQDNLKDQTDQNIKGALVAVDPRTGGVLAYYGGPNTVKNDKGKDQLATDWANTPQNPGSSMKAYDLTAFLKMGKGLGETFDGSNNRMLGGRKVRNAGDSSSCSKQCTVKTAMELSVNTVFYDMVLNDVKPARVADAAKEAGVRPGPQGKGKLGTADANISLGGGATTVTPEDMAAGYSSFASGGVRRDQHFVAKLTNAQDETIFDLTTNQGKPAFDPNNDKSKQIAGNVTEALIPVIAHSKLKCPTGHQCAGKTGTQQYSPQDGDPSTYDDRNAQTWMVGYTPSVSVAAWIGGDGNKPLHDKNNKPIFGSTIAGPTWQDFMDAYLKDKPAEKFDQVAPIGKQAVDTPTTTASRPPKTQNQTTETTTTAPPPSTEAPSTPSTPPSSSKTLTTSNKPPVLGGEPPGNGFGPPGGGGGG